MDQVSKLWINMQANVRILVLFCILHSKNVDNCGAIDPAPISLNLPKSPIQPTGSSLQMARGSK